LFVVKFERSAVMLLFQCICSKVPDLASVQFVKQIFKSFGVKTHCTL
jgi:hypothetical protein